MNLLPPPSTLPPGSIVDSYRRDSGGPRQGESTDQQLAEIEAWCLHHQLIHRKRFVDKAKSGGSLVGRDDFERMLNTYYDPAERPQGLILWNYARFARDIDDAQLNKIILRKKWGIIIHSLTDPIPEGVHGRMIEFWIDLTNEEKRRQTSRDAKRGLKALVEKYGCVPGTPPRGFKREPHHIGTNEDGSVRTAHRWVPDPDLLQRVRTAFSLKASGATLAEIHTQTKLYTGINAYRAMFTNQLFIGTLLFGELIVEKYCEPVIDLATWNAVQKRLEAHAQAKYDRQHPRRVHTPYILSGFVFCAKCGSPLSANTVTGGPRGRNEAYRCNRSKRRAGCEQGRIGRRPLEEAIIHTLKEYILVPDVLREMYAVAGRSQTHHAERQKSKLDALHAEKKKLTSKITNLASAIAERGHSSALLTKLTQLETELHTTKLEITEWETATVTPPPALNEEQIIQLSNSLQQRINFDAPTAVRAALMEFIQEIKVYKTEDKAIAGTITYYLPTPNESPPFEVPLPQGTGYNLPIAHAPMGAHLYRQIFTHPICRNNKPHS